MKYYVRKCIGLFVTILLVTTITFAVFEILPGDPALIILGVDADPVQIEALHESMGYNLPPLQRFVNWIIGLLSGDLGDSYRYHQSVSLLISNSFKVTRSLAIVTMCLIILIGFPIGIWLAKNSHKKIGTLFSMLSQVSLSIPAFCMGILLINIFCVQLKLFPSMGYTSLSEGFIPWLKSLFLPALSIALGSSATLIRYIRSSILTEENKDYVRTIRSKGASSNIIMIKHVLRNAMIPVITILGLIVTDILGGSIIIENVFSLPGIGKLVATSITTRDLPLIQGLVLYLALIVVICNFLVDILYSIIDPRIRIK